MKKCSFFAAVAAAALLLTACPNMTSNKEKDKGQDHHNQGNTPAGSTVSFESFKTRSISVKNNTGERLVAFKGSIEASSLISGVPANASNHGLRMDETLFNATGDFALLFLTEEVYNKNKNNLAAVKNSPFASIYAFYNKTGSNDLVYNISSNSGGKAKLTLNNNSPFNVEIRVNSPEGEVLGYVGAYTMLTTINMQPGDYMLYPVFKKFMPRDNEIYSQIPEMKTSKKPYVKSLGITDAASWDIGNLWDASKLNLSAGGFYITINNQSTDQDVMFLQGSDVYTTSLGIKNIKHGHHETFFVRFQKNPDGSYPEKFSMSALRIGAPGYSTVVSEFEFHRDMKYEITVKGSEVDNLQLSEIKQLGKVDVNKIYDLK
ncbi:MAG: hypothetical protein ACTTH7_09925 [Treponema sp.]